MKLGVNSDTVSRFITNPSYTAVWALRSYSSLRSIVVLEDHGTVALAAVVTVLHHGHEHTGAALLARALSPQTVDLAVLVNLVEPEYG